MLLAPSKPAIITRRRLIVGGAAVAAAAALPTALRAVNSSRWPIGGGSIIGNVLFVFGLSAFVGGINDLLIVTAAVAFFGALSALFLIRSRDFVARGGPAAAH